MTLHYWVAFRFRMLKTLVQLLTKWKKHILYTCIQLTVKEKWQKIKNEKIPLKSWNLLPNMFVKFSKGLFPKFSSLLYDNFAQLFQISVYCLTSGNLDSSFYLYLNIVYICIFSPFLFHDYSSCSEVWV